MMKKNHRAKIVGLCVMLAALTACGQKGELYLPNKPNAVPAPAPASTPAAEANPELATPPAP